MREIPDCLNRRYQALDELIKELSSAIPAGGGAGGPATERQSNENNQIGIRLMCDFWNILKDDPECNLSEEVQQRMGVEDGQECGICRTQRINCYMANKEQEQSSNEDRKRDVMNKIRHIYCPSESRGSNKKSCCNYKIPTPSTDKSPLSKVLCNLKEAASFDQKCNVRVTELIAAQKELTEQIQNLEAREKEGVRLLKQADCMWSCMEETYKKKVTESLDRQKELLRELKEVESSANKWRKNRKDLEFQLATINKCQEDIMEKINQKNNDIKVMEMEIGDYSNRIESNKKDIEAAKNSWKSKKEASDARMANLAKEMKKLNYKVDQEQRLKADKEKEGSKYVKDARDDLQKICRVLLQKKLENEDLQAEKQALLQEIDLLKKTCNTCTEKCTNKEKMIEEEIKRIERELVEFKLKCTNCHVCTDTTDVRKFCTDCPRCLAERDCLYEDDHCSPDHTMDCVCMSVKQKFLDNVFDNMYTVLERQAKTCPGKAVADCILNCLKRSRNGKLNEETRKILQDFILSTVKKNLNLTIVGGAVKTRCEMDQETYKQLMLCLKEVVVAQPAKENKGTAKKEPCSRWGGPTECNCPGGPKACVCTKKAPPPPKDPVSCGPHEIEDKKDQKICPPRGSGACGTDCGILGYPDQVGADVSAMKRDPCGSKTCPFSKNVRAAQCVLGPEPLQTSVLKPHQPIPPIVPSIPELDKMATCTCGGKETKPCTCRRDPRRQPRQRIIEEVMGRYTEVSPIEKVTRVAERKFGVTNSSRVTDAGCDCSNLPMKYLLASTISDRKISRYCACLNNYVSRGGRTPYRNKLRKKGHIISICRSSKSHNDLPATENVTLMPDVGYETPQIKIPKKESDNDIKVILCPKFPHTYDDDKKQISLSTNKVQEGAHMRLKSNSSSKIDNLCDASFFGREICENLKELMKDIVVPQVPATNTLSSSEVEWVTLESLLKEISSLKKLEYLTSDSLNEVEVKCETLEDSKDFKLLTKKNSEVKSITFPNMIGIQQNIILNQKEGTDKTNENGISENNYKNEDHHNMIAEEMKLKLLDDIRQTYKMSVDTSLEKIIFKKPDFNERISKNVGKCLRNLDESSLEPNQYTKHVKAEVTEKCNIGTCANFWEQIEDNLQVPSVPNNVLFNAQKQEQLLEEYLKNIQDGTREQLKVAIENEIGESTHQFTELKKTNSGRIALELDENIIELIEKKSKEDPLFLSLKKTDSGHLLIDFDMKVNAANANQRVTIRQTPSGTKLLDVHKNLVSMLKHTLLKEIPNSDLSNNIKLSSSPKRKESPQQLVTDKHSPLIVSKKIAKQEHYSKGNKEIENDFKRSKKSPISSRTSSKHTNKEQFPLPTFLKEVTSIIVKKQSSHKVKCKCTPGENMEKDQCICPPSTKCIKSQSAPIEDIKDRKRPLPPYSWKPGQKITRKEKLACIKTTPDSVETGESLKVIKTGCDCTHDSHTTNSTNNTTNSWITADSRSALSVDELDFMSELKELYKQGNAEVSLKIQGKSGVVRKLSTVVTRTLSGTMAIYSRNMSSLGGISFDGNEYPVLLSKTVSGTYFVGFGEYDRTLNATLRKTTSGGMLLVPKSKFIRQKKQNLPRFEECFNVKVSGVRENPVELPAVLKTTPSDNYIIVLDKEFENSYRQTVNEYIGVKGECIIDLNRTNSGNFEIKLDTEGENHLVKKNALLVKSSSGNIKVLVRGFEFEAMVLSMSKSSSSSSAKTFGELVNKLPVSSRQIHRENLKKSKYLDKKASNDTQIHGSKGTIESNKRLLSEPSAVLKKIASGQYAIILNKESKKAFINNLQSYIAGNSKGLVPIKRSESGEIIINLNSTDDSKGHYGALKITSSGNIYVMVDEDVIKVMAKSSNTNEVSSRTVDTKSTYHGTEKKCNSVKKAVTTSCNAKPEVCCSDPSKCVCSELLLDSTDWFYADSETKKQPSILKKYKDDINKKRADKYCGKAKKNTPRDKSPHIVIKPACDCRPPPSKKKFRSGKECYYLLDTVCPYHKNRYNTVSNEILEISGCNEVQRDKMEFPSKSNAPYIKKRRPVWDSLNYLPPQLPPFLKNVSYRH